MQADFATCAVLSYNRPALLAQSLATLRNANYPLELIVHDDGSMDAQLLSTLHRLQREGLVSSLILNPPGHNQGQGVALNRMFQMAKGDPIFKLDQDLVYEEGWLGTAIDLMGRNPDVGLLGLFHYPHDPVDSRKTKIGEGSGVSYHTHICGSGFAVRRAAWEELGPFNEHSDAFAEDWEFQVAIHESERWRNALPDHGLVTNVGFGIGPSTVVEAEGVVHKINHGPKVYP